jgi:2-dehydro-3-deoxyglucarate aldolase
MSAANLDFLCIDAEHSAVDITQVLVILQAIKAGNPGTFSIVRLPGNCYSDTKRYLDAGAMGVIAPLINNGEEASELVRSVKYPPIGGRGVGFGRSHGYGFNFDEYMSSANDNTCICVQIEHIKAVENIDEIFSVEGIDAAFIGPYDLSASLGITGQFDHPSYIKAWEKILTKCNEYKIIPGIHVIQPDIDQVIKYVNLGFKMIAYTLDITMLGVCYREGLKKIKETLKNDSQ